MILPSPTAPLGSVRHLSSYTPSLFPLGSAILCRNTAPLVSFAYALLHRDVPCRILGRDIGTQLSTIVKKMYATDLSDLLSRLYIWHARETEIALSSNRSPERVDDQYQCLVFFIDSLDENSRRVSDLLAKIDLMFTDDQQGTESRITLSTIHKAKGQEFPTVFLLDKEKYMPSKYATQPWQRVQEKNLLYVAITRAQENLFYIQSGCWKEEKAV